MADRTCAACSRTFHGRKRRYCYDCLPEYRDDPTLYMRTYMRLEYARTYVAPEPRGPMHHPTRKDMPVIAECGWCLGEFVWGARRRWCGARCKKLGRRHVDEHGHADRRSLTFCRTCGTLVAGRKPGAEFCYEHRPDRVTLPAGRPCKFCAGPTPKAGRIQCDACMADRKNERWLAKQYMYAKRTTAKGDYTTDAIAARDKWRCQLCNRKLNTRHKFPHPFSVSIDHIVPITKGGTDEAANVQLACLGCNMKKSNGVHGVGEQLRLVG